MKTKTCSKCKIEKELDAFCKTKHGKEGVCSICKKCRILYRANNKEHAMQYDREYKLKHREHNREYSKTYNKTNKEARFRYAKKYNANNPDKLREARKQRTVNHPMQATAYRHARRSRARCLESNFTPEQWENVKNIFNGACAYCGKAVGLHQDHFIALTKEGEYSRNNIVPACPTCNHSKYNISFFIWYPKQSFYSKKREAKILKFLNYDNGIQQLAF